MGHAFGFAHTAFFMVQGSLMFTRAHLNKYWRLLLEIWVAIHGGVVAAQTGGDVLWPMFAFGFMWLFVFTQGVFFCSPSFALSPFSLCSIYHSYLTLPPPL